ncbi:MAG: M18 family aminopeptidase [Micrococcaceae bacterium]
MSVTSPTEHSTDTYLDDLADFITASPSSYHAAEETARRLEASGYRRLSESEPFPSEAGGYVVVRDGAVVAWSLPGGELGTQKLPAFRILGAHTDSPTFKLKPNPSSTTAGWNQAGVEVYGGPLANSWLDRDLCFAGRLISDDGETHLVHTDPIARIPQLAIHLDREVNNGLTLDRQRHLHPIFSADAEAADVMTILARHAGLSADEITGADIVAIDSQRPARFGARDEFFAAGRLDNLASVHAGVTSLSGFNAQLPELDDDAPVIPMLAAFDHEEVGSASRTGAGGPLLEEILGRILEALGITTVSDRSRVLGESWLLSADCGHLVHPNYPERHDPDNHPRPNAGVLLKINANQRYATDGAGASAFSRWCAAAEVPFQEFVSNNTVPCGSTIGPISATRLGIRTIDIGIGLLSMHSIREMCGAEDPRRLGLIATAFYSGA